MYYYPEVLKRGADILSWLEDDISKKVFMYRVMANMSGDVRYIHELTKEIGFPYSEADSLFETSKKYDEYERYDVITYIKKKSAGRDLVLCGSDRFAERYYSLISVAGYELDYVLDNERRGEIFHDKSIISVDELDVSGACFIITSKRYTEEIKEMLVKNGADENFIFLPPENDLLLTDFRHKTYFDNDIWIGREDEIFVDGGAYNLRTTVDFTEFAKSYQKVYAFELEAENIKKCKKTLSDHNIKNLELINAALWDKNETVNFTSGSYGSFINNEGSSGAKAVSLDSILDGKPCTMIKLDIEGSELAALKGARHTITEHKPRLAICLYHKEEDMFEIPEYIKSLVPDYRFKMRHYSTFFYDTVLFAE